MTIGIREIDHLALRIVNLEAMLACYCNVLGCTIARRRDDLGLIQLRAGSSMIDLLAFDGERGRAGGPAPGAEDRNMDHFCPRVEPFDAPAIRRHFDRHGVSAGPTAARFGAEGDGPPVRFVDPEGNTVELKGPPAG